MGKDTPVKISEHFKTLTDPRIVGTRIDGDEYR